MGLLRQSREEWQKSGDGRVQDKRLDARPARIICWCNPRANSTQSKVRGAISKVYLQIDAQSGKAQRVDVNA